MIYYNQVKRERKKEIEKYIKVEDVIYGLQNIKKVKIGDIKKSKHIVKNAPVTFCEGWVEITYMDNTYEIIHIHLEENDEDKMRRMQKDLVERIYKILLDK